MKKQESKKNTIRISGEADIFTFCKHTGKVLNREKIHNLELNGGLERIARRLISNSEDYFDYIAIGTGTTAAQNTDTALETEVTRAQATVSYVASYKAQFTKIFTFGSGESYTITEAGVFDDATASGSTALNRLVFTGKAVDSDTSLSITITITVGRA